MDNAFAVRGDFDVARNVVRLNVGKFIAVATVPFKVGTDVNGFVDSGDRKIKPVVDFIGFKAYVATN